MKSYRRFPGVLASALVVLAASGCVGTPPRVAPPGPALHPAPALDSPRAPAYALAALTETTLLYYIEWLDLDTGTVTSTAPPPATADIRLDADILSETQYFIEVNRQAIDNVYTGPTVAISAEAYANVTYFDLIGGGLTFFVPPLGEDGVGTVPFDAASTVIVQTPTGRAYKLRFIEGDVSTTTVRFQWEEVLPVSPRDAAAAIITQVVQLSDDGTLTSGQAGSLKTKLEGSIVKLDAAKLNTAANQIGAFRNEVAAMRHAGALSETQALALTEAADEILVALDP